MHLQAAELIAIDQTCVQTDLVWEMKENLSLWCVTEKDSIRERMTAEDEFVTDPEKLLFCLLVKRFQGMNASMDAEKRLHRIIVS